MSEPEKLVVTVNESDTVTALLYPAAKSSRLGTTIVLAHGAGQNQLSGFMRLVANGLASRGFDVMTFNFVYMERGKSVPDQKPKLEACYRAVIGKAIKHKKLKSNRLLIGGKSMGGRIASQVAAEDAESVAGLVFLGYPLHPPGQPDKLRTEHWKTIKIPMLFLQGTRDAFGTPDEIKSHLKKLRLRAKVHVIETGDHSFKVHKSAGLSQDAVYEGAMDAITEWAKDQ